jgi:hypothetical protein
MLNLKKAEIIGHHSYCEGSSRKMVIDASEDVWATQNQMAWDASSPSPEIGSLDTECLQTNIQIHGTPARNTSLLNCRELCCFPGTLPKLSSRDIQSGKQRRLEDMHEFNCGSNPILTLVPPECRGHESLFTPSIPIACVFQEVSKRRHIKVDE